MAGRLLRPRPIHRQSDPVARKEFNRQWPEKLKSIAARHPDKQLQVYFQDESRFGQQGTTTNVWAKKGLPPTAIRQTQHQYLWGIGAVCPLTGHVEGLISPQLNKGVINLLSAQFSRTLPPDELAVMIWDGAGFRRSHSLSATSRWCNCRRTARNLTRSKICGTISRATTGATEPATPTTPSKKPPWPPGNNPSSTPNSGKPSATLPISKRADSI